MTLFLSREEAFVVVFSVSGEGRGERICIFFAMYLRFAFLIWMCARCFHGTFSQINLCHFSGEALSLLSAFVYFTVVSLLVPTACKTFCSKKWNSILVPAAEQFVPQSLEFLLNQPPLNPLGIIWLSQLQSKFSIMDP